MWRQFIFRSAKEAVIAEVGRTLAVVFSGHTITFRVKPSINSINSLITLKYTSLYKTIDKPIALNALNYKIAFTIVSLTGRACGLTGTGTTFRIILLPKRSISRVRGLALNTNDTPATLPGALWYVI